MTPGRGPGKGMALPAPKAENSPPGGESDAIFSSIVRKRGNQFFEKTMRQQKLRACGVISKSRNML
jgi:hypothetical protein